MRKTGRSLPKIYFWLLLIAVFLLFSTGPLFSAAAAESAASDSNVEQMMAGLSDEQVRQLLIDELKKDAEVEELAPEQMKGPAFFLYRLLFRFSKEHDDSEDQIKALFASFPTMGQELYRVFIKL